MKVSHDVKLNLSDIGVSYMTRSDLAKDIEKYWVGQPQSNIGLQYLELKDGIIHVRKNAWERTDLIMFQFLTSPTHGGFNCFVESDGSLIWNVFSTTEMGQEEIDQVEKHIQEELRISRHHNFLAHERAFLNAKPWEAVDGMTPEEAVAKFKELGWY